MPHLCCYKLVGLIFIHNRNYLLSYILKFHQGELSSSDVFKQQKLGVLQLSVLLLLLGIGAASCIQGYTPAISLPLSNI